MLQVQNAVFAKSPLSHKSTLNSCYIQPLYCSHLAAVNH